MDDGTSNSIAESKDVELSSDVSATHSQRVSPTPSTLSTTDLRHAAEKITNDIASTFSTLGATFLSSPYPHLTSNANGKQSKGGFIDACWIVQDEPSVIARHTAMPQVHRNHPAASNVPGIKEKLQLVDVADEEPSTPVQRIRQQETTTTEELLDPVHEMEAASPSSNKRSQGAVVESWKRKMKIAQKKREQEANDLSLTHPHRAPDNETNASDAEEQSFIRPENDAIFEEDDDDDNNSHFIKACQPAGNKEGSTVLDPLFSAAMTLEGIPSSRRELMDLVTGKCRVMIGADEDASTDSEETDDWSDSNYTPESPRRRRRKPTRSSRSARKSRGRRDRSREDSERRRTSKSPSPNKRDGHSRGQQQSKKNTSPPAVETATSVDQSEITMSPERNREHSRRPVTPPRRQQQQQQRTPPSTEKIAKPAASFDVKTPSPEMKTTTTKPRSAIKTTPSYPSAATKAANTPNVKDKNFIKVFIREISQKGVRMMWYQDKNSQKPTTVVLFLQHGHKSNEAGSHSGPAMVWAVDNASQQNQLFYGVNLFDIRTLERANASMLGPRSYAMPSRSIFMRLAKGNEFIFEAPNEQEAFRFVHGMKWVIARLAFNLVIGNMDVVCELVEVDKKKGEATMARAMDDVTLQMVDKSILKVVQ